ncbi:MAG: hypothetical protein JXR14_12795 [Paracoccaceae bacterium]
MKASDQDRRTPPDGPAIRAAFWIILIAFVVLTRPYRGLYHDAYLYAAQTLRRLDPANLAGDVIFEFGNQDSFTLFTALYAPFVEALGHAQADLLFWALGLAVWLAALARLAGHLFPERTARFFALAAAVLLSARYGNGVLSYGEGYVVPRPFAEAAGLIAIYFGLKGKHAYGLGLTLVAGVLHPLTGLGVAALWLWFAVRSFAIWLAIACAAALVGLALGWIGLVPFTWLFERYDPAWLALLSGTASMGFPSAWAGNGVIIMLPAITSLVIVALRGDAAPRALARSVLIVGGATLLAAIIGADLLANRFLTSLQLWRGLLWIALLGNLLSIAALCALPAGSWSRRLFMLACLFNVIEFQLDRLPAMSSAAACLAMLSLLIEMRARPAASSWVGRFLALPAVFAGLTLLSLSVPEFGTGVGTRLGLCLALLAACLWWTNSAEHLPRMSVVVILALIGGLMLWDVRTPWQRYVLGDAVVPGEIRSALAGRVVYWDNALDLAWFKLKTPQFYACRQQGGQLFFRAQAMEVARRADILRSLNGDEFEDVEGTVCTAKADLGAKGPVSRAQFVDVCGKLPELDLIVLRTKLDGLPRLSWSMPVPDRDVTHQSAAETEFHFYFCEDFRPG